MSWGCTHHMVLFEGALGLPVDSSAVDWMWRPRTHQKAVQVTQVRANKWLIWVVAKGRMKKNLKNKNKAAGGRNISSIIVIRYLSSDWRVKGKHNRLKNINMVIFLNVTYSISVSIGKKPSCITSRSCKEVQYSNHCVCWEFLHHLSTELCFQLPTLDSKSGSKRENPRLRPN